MSHILAIDQGTTSSRAIVFDAAHRQSSPSAQEEFPQHFPQSGWVEHDPDDIWSTRRRHLPRRDRAGRDRRPPTIAAIGITNQRETTLVWERATGRPLGRAIVWQDRRTSALCAELRAAGHEPMVTARTGLLLDPYFSGTKLKWLLDAHEGARERARRGELLFGTVDSYLIWKLTGGRAHVTDATNAARTLLYNIHVGAWDPEICDLLDIPLEMLPEVRDCAADFGTTRADLFGREIPILGVAGDQQAATVGQACFAPGMLKSTYGTGCFAVLNTGDDAGREPQPAADHHRLPARRQADLRARRLDLHRRRGGAVAARRAEDHPQRRRDPGARRGGRPGAAALPRAGLHRPRRALLGPGLPRRDLRPHPQLRPGRVRPRGARERRLPDPRPRSRRCAPTGRTAAATPCCGSTAA